MNMNKKSSDHQALENSDSEPENVSLVPTSTIVKTKATTFKATPINSRNTDIHTKTAHSDLSQEMSHQCEIIVKNVCPIYQSDTRIKHKDEKQQRNITAKLEKNIKDVF